jgi:hypothetical protein
MPPANTQVLETFQQLQRHPMTTVFSPPIFFFFSLLRQYSHIAVNSGSDASTVAPKFSSRSSCSPPPLLLTSSYQARQ